MARGPARARPAAAGIGRWPVTLGIVMLSACGADHTPTPEPTPLTTRASPGHGSAVDLLTYSVEDDGTLRPFASLPFSPDDTLRADQMVVTAPAP